MKWPKLTWLKPTIAWLPVLGIALLTVALYQGAVLEGFSFQKEVSLVDIATGLLTLFLAFYVPYRIEKVINTQRYELEALINEVRQVLAYFDSALVAVQTSSNPVTPEESETILSSIVSAGQTLQVLETLFNENNLIHLTKSIGDIRDKRFIFKRLATGGQFQDPHFTYNQATVSLLNAAYHDIKLECLRLIFQINRS